MHVRGASQSSDWRGRRDEGGGVVSVRAWVGGGGGKGFWLVGCFGTCGRDAWWAHLTLSSGYQSLRNILKRLIHLFVWDSW
jgi:hypothetical protein